MLLLEHFRCVEPIIDFSNKLCYNKELVPVRLASKHERLEPPLVKVHVPDGVKSGKVGSSCIIITVFIWLRFQVNRREAEEIVKEVCHEFSLDFFGFS